MPSPLSTPHARQFFTKIRAIKKTATLQEACALLRIQVTEAYASEAALWNDVSRAHLLGLAVECFRHLQDMDYLLKLAQIIDSEIKEAMLNINSGVQVKETFLLLYKARIAVMHNRQEYGYLTLNLESIDAQFGRTGLRTLLEASREACKAYISILCLCFNEQWDQEYQLGYSYLATKLAEATQLNEEVLVGKHAYQKYTPKLKIHSLRIPDLLTFKQADDLCQEILEQYPTGKHASEVLDLLTRKALQMDLTRVPDLLEKQKKLAREQFLRERPELEEKAPLNEQVCYQIYRAEANELHYAFWTKTQDQISDILDTLAALRKALTGLPIEEDFNFLFKVIKQMRSGSVLETVNIVSIDALLTMIQDLVTSKNVTLGALCYFGFEVLLISERTQVIFEKNPLLEQVSSHSLSFCGRTRNYFARVLSYYLYKHLSYFKAYYSVYDEKYFTNIFDTLTFHELLEFRTSLNEQYDNMKTAIEVGNSSLSLASGPVRFVEEMLIEVLVRLASMQERFVPEMIDVQKNFLTGFTSGQVLPKKFLEGISVAASKGNEEVADLLLSMSQDELSQQAKNEFKLFKIDSEGRKINKRMLSIRACRELLQTTSKETVKYEELQTKLALAKVRLAESIEESEARLEEDQDELAAIYGQHHIIPYAHFYPLKVNQMINKQCVLGEIKGRADINKIRFQLADRLAQVKSQDEKTMVSYFKMLIHAKGYGLITLHLLISCLYPNNFHVLLNAKELLDQNPDDERNDQKYETTREEVLAHSRDFNLQMEQAKSGISFVKMQIEGPYQTEHTQTTFRVVMDLVEMTRLYYTLDVANYEQANELYDELMEELSILDPIVIAYLKVSLLFDLEKTLLEMKRFREFAQEEWDNSMVRYTSKLPSKSTFFGGSALVIGALGVAWMKINRAAK